MYFAVNTQFAHSGEGNNNQGTLLCSQKSHMCEPGLFDHIWTKILILVVTV